MSTEPSPMFHGSESLEPQSRAEPRNSDEERLAALGYKQELDRALGLFSSFAVQFSSVAVGSAIFTAMIFGLSFFGPAAIWSYLVGGFFQVFLVGAAVAALVSAYPLSGGVYQIINRLTRQTWLGWQAGWLLIIGHTVACAGVAVSVVPYVAAWVGQDASTFSGLKMSVWAAVIVALVTIINLGGVRMVALINNVGVVAEIFGLLLVFGALLIVKHPTQPASILVSSGGAVGEGKSALLAFALAMLLPTYMISSFDATGNAAEETKNASRTAPIGSMIATISAWIAGVIFMLLILLAVPDVNEFMASATPVKYVLDSAVGPTIAYIFEILAMAALLAAMVVMQLTGARILWSQARDGQYPAAHLLYKVSKKSKIPVNATLVCFIIPVILVFWSSALSVLASLSAVTWAMAYGAAVIVGLFAVLKRQLPAAPFHLGPLTIPVFALAAVWSVFICALIVWSDPANVGIALLMAIVIGFAIYFMVPRARRGRVPGIHDVEQAERI